MSGGGGFWALAAGVLARDPERRTSAGGAVFATATIRVGSGDEASWVGVVAFAEAAERLLQLHAGDAVSASGRGELRRWTGKDGVERTGLSVVAGEIAAARPRPRSDGAPRRQAAHPGPRQRDGGAAPAADGRSFDDPLPAEWGAS